MKRVSGCFLLLVALLLLAVAYTFFPRFPLPKDVKVSKILLEKNKRRLRLLAADGSVIRSYYVALGARPKGDKEMRGDERTPEGTYYLDFRNANSKFFRSYHISYPDSNDKSHSHRRGMDPGGDIMVHGLPEKLAWIGRWHRWWDWTDGCVGLTNPEISEIWNAIGNRKIQIEIRP
jgi:murein L,D-transpeptidase YafK